MTLPYLQGMIPEVPKATPPPPPDNILAKIIAAMIFTSSQNVGNAAARVMRSAGDAQKESWKKFLSNPNAANSVDIAGDLVMPMAGSLKAFNSVARNPRSADFLDNLYSRLSAAVTSGPPKGQGQQWLRHLEKGAAKGEIDHTGLKDFLERNLGRVISKDEIFNVASKNPVKLGEEIYEFPGTGYASHWPNLPDNLKTDPGTYKEIVLSSNLPEGSNNSLRVRPLEQPGQHFDPTNQVGHLRTRLGERDGKKSLVLGEVQSDTHQNARTEGRLSKSGEKLPSEVERLYQRFKKVDAELAAHKKAINAGDPNVTTEGDYQLRKKWSEAEAVWKDYSQGRGGVLPLPFQSDKEWPELLLKRALFEAAKNNADEVFIPSGNSISEAVGMPAGGQKFYDKDLPNQMLEYVKKQLGVQVTPEALQKASGGAPTLRKIYETLNPRMVGPNQWAIPDLPGPLPERYEEFLVYAPVNNVQASPEAIDEVAKAFSLIASKFGGSNLPGISGMSGVNANAFRADAGLLMDRLRTPVTTVPDGTAIPLPPEARDKILTDGQRLWAALISTLGGTAALNSNRKKNEDLQDSSRTNRSTHRRYQ